MHSRIGGGSVRVMGEAQSYPRRQRTRDGGMHRRIGGNRRQRQRQHAPAELERARCQVPRGGLHDHLPHGRPAREEHNVEALRDQALDAVTVA